MVQVKICFLTSKYDFKRTEKVIADIIKKSFLKIENKHDLDKYKVGIYKLEKFKNFIAGISFYELEGTPKESFMSLKKKYSNLQKLKENSQNKIKYCKAFFFIILKNNGLTYIYSDSTISNNKITKKFLKLINKFLDDDCNIQDPKIFTFPERKLDALRTILLRNKAKEHKLDIDYDILNMGAQGSLHGEPNLETVKSNTNWNKWQYYGYEFEGPNINYFQFPKNTRKYFIVNINNSISITDFERMLNIFERFRGYFEEAIEENLISYLYNSFRKLDEFQKNLPGL